MENEPVVSVVIATYNYGHFVGAAVQSALAQTLSDIEVFAVDDGSTDDTEAVLRPYLADPRFHYVKTENRGQPSAENTGIRMARANHVAFLDADDLWLPTKLEKQIEVFERDPSLGVVYTRRLLIDAENYILEYDQPELYRGYILDRMFLFNFVPFPSTMVSRKVFDKVGLFNEKTRQVSDYELWLRVAPHFRFDYVDEPLLLYRCGHGSLRDQGRPYYIALEIMNRFLDEQGGRSLLDPKLVRKSFADTYRNLGFLMRGSSRLTVLKLFMKSLSYRPTCVETWKGLASVTAPGALLVPVRRLLGRPTARAPRRIGGPLGKELGSPLEQGGELLAKLVADHSGDHECSQLETRLDSSNQ